MFNAIEEYLAGPTRFASAILQQLGGIIKSMSDLLIVNLGKAAMMCLRALRFTSLFSLRLYGLLYIVPITRNLVVQFMPYIQGFG